MGIGIKKYVFVFCVILTLAFSPLAWGLSPRALLQRTHRSLPVPHTELLRRKIISSPYPDIPIYCIGSPSFLKHMTQVVQQGRWTPLFLRLFRDVPFFMIEKRYETVHLLGLQVPLEDESAYALQLTQAKANALTLSYFMDIPDFFVKESDRVLLLHDDLSFLGRGVRTMDVLSGHELWHLLLFSFPEYIRIVDVYLAQLRQWYPQREQYPWYQIMHILNDICLAICQIEKGYGAFVYAYVQQGNRVFGQELSSLMQAGGDYVWLNTLLMLAQNQCLMAYDPHEYAMQRQSARVISKIKRAQGKMYLRMKVNMLHYMTDTQMRLCEDRATQLIGLYQQKKAFSHQQLPEIFSPPGRNREAWGNNTVSLDTQLVSNIQMGRQV